MHTTAHSKTNQIQSFNLYFYFTCKLLRDLCLCSLDQLQNDWHHWISSEITQVQSFFQGLFLGFFGTAQPMILYITAQGSFATKCSKRGLYHLSYSDTLFSNCTFFRSGLHKLPSGLHKCDVQFCTLTITPAFLSRGQRWSAASTLSMAAQHNSVPGTA